MDDLSGGNGVFSSVGQSGEGIQVIFSAKVTKVPAFLFYPHNSSSYIPKIVSIEFEKGSACESIGDSAFAGSNSLTSITIPFVGATKVGTSNTHFGYIFGAPSHSDQSSYIPASLKTVVITGGTVIEYGAFYKCNNLTSILLPECVTSIGNYAFSGCSSLTSIVLPECVTSIGNYAFSGCSSLTSIVLPECVTSIGNYAFSGCSSLTSIVLPEGVTTIGNSAFDACYKLVSITIPRSMKTIGKKAFYTCIDLEDVYYFGTEEEWNSITLLENNNSLSYATIHYNYQP